MGSMSIYHWVILGIVVLVLFGGGGKISSLMGDFAKGIKSFKKNMAEEETLPDQSSSVGRPQAVPPSVSHQEQKDDVNLSDHLSPSPRQETSQQDKH